MHSWTFAGCLILALVLAGFRIYLTRTSHWLNVHSSKIDLLKPEVDDPLKVVRGEAELISHDRLTAGFALAEARWECGEAYRWLNRCRSSESKEQAPPSSRFKSEFYAWLILRQSRSLYLIALKHARPQELTCLGKRKLAKLGEQERFHQVQADEFIERLNRKR